MSLRFSSQLAIDNLPDEQTNDQFEVIMPTLYLNNDEENRKQQERDLDNNRSRGDLTRWDNLKNLAGNLASSIGFGVGKDFKTYQPIVEEITFPQQGFVTETRRVRTGWLNLPKDFENLHEVAITMFCPQDMSTQQYLQAWQNMIFNKEGEYYYSSQVYKRNIVVFQWGPDLTTGGLGQHFNYTKYTLYGCFPKAQQDYQLTYAKPERFRIMANFCVDKIRCDFSHSNRIPLLSTPTNIVGNVLEGIGNTISGTNVDTGYQQTSVY